MYDHLNTLSSRAADRAALAEQQLEYLASGKKIAALPGYTPAPLPARRRWVDPETKLKRKRRSSVTLKKLADAMEPKS